MQKLTIINLGNVQTPEKRNNLEHLATVILKVRAQKKSLGRSERSQIKWPPVDLGKEFILFDEELSVEARFLVKETENGFVLECRELDCDNRHFGTRFTSSHYHATQHLNTRHQTHEIEGGSILHRVGNGRKKGRRRPPFARHKSHNSSNRYAPCRV